MPRRALDPFANSRFALVLGEVQVAGFAECTGLAAETKVLEYQEGGRNSSTLKFPDVSSFGNVTLKRGMTRSNDLIAWQMDVVEGRFEVNRRDQDPGGQFRSGNVAVELQDEKGETVRRFNLVRAFPVKWIGPDLKANASEVAIESLELAHEGIVET